MRGEAIAPGAMARAFHEGTKHSWDSVRRRGHFLDWDNKPRPFKVYEDVPTVPLPREMRVPGIGAVEAMVAPFPADGDATPDVTDLARILFLAAGAHRPLRVDGELFHFRTYASAGALYPVEVYVASADLPGLPAGVFHFDPREFRLARLREGNHQAFLARASGGEESVAGAPVVLALTGVPWKTGWKYTERGYRHIFWDAGMVLANLLAAAGSAGFPARVVMGFVDAEVETLLGLDGVEFPLCLVSVGRAAPVEPAGRPPERISPVARPYSGRELVFEAVRQANDAGRLDRPEAVPAWRSTRVEEPAPRERSVARAAREGSAAPPDSLDEVIRRRGSARRFARGGIPAATLEAILGAATAGVPFDHAAGGWRAVVPYVVANAVDGLAQGAYVFRDEGLVLLREGRFRNEAGYLCLEQRLAADAAATVFLMTDLEGALASMGDRGYRVAQLEGGIVGGRMYLGAYAHRFGATGLTFYDDDVVEFFTPDAAGTECMLVVAVGESPRLRRGAG